MITLSLHRSKLGTVLFALAPLLSWAVVREARADSLIINGGFESGFSGWSRADQLGSDGSFMLQSGTVSPVNGDPVAAPPEGSFAAMTDAQGPGTHVLFQDFLVPTVASPLALLSFELFIANRADTFSVPNPATLDFSGRALNQQARVDILRAGTDPFSVLASDVLLNVYQTLPGDPAVSGYTSINADVTALFAANAGSMLRLRFAEADNVFTFQLGVDNVSLSSVPEPPALVMCVIGLLVVGFCLRERLLATR